ncbi:MAG TPA: J domain-containing protein [Bdellovibrionota bacterium]|nr:J domain-containing protein [Bdellovibrionota bacterium]
MKSPFPKLLLSRSAFLCFALYFCAISLAAAEGETLRPDPGAKDLYARLGVSRDADRKTVREAYLRLATKFHSDSGVDDPLSDEAMKRIGEAWEVLKDPGSRGSYTSDLKVGRLHPKYQASTTLPKYYEGVPREQASAEPPVPKKTIPPEVLAFREASAERRTAFGILLDGLKADLSGLHPQVNERAAKRYYRRVSEASENFLRSHRAETLAVVNLCGPARETNTLDTEIKSLLVAHLETLRTAFDTLFHYDLYLEDMLAWKEHLEALERQFVLAGFDLTKLGVRETRALLDSYYQKNYYAIQNLFESLRHQKNTEREAQAVRAGLAALIEFPTLPQLRWLAGAHRFWISLDDAEITDRAVVAHKLVTYLEEAEARGDLKAADTDAILVPLLGQFAAFAESTSDDALRTRLRDFNAARVPPKVNASAAENASPASRWRAWGESLRTPCVWLLNLARRRR